MADHTRLGALWTALMCGYPDVVGTLLPHWNEERVRVAEQETEHYLHGTVTAPRVKSAVRDEAFIARRDARVLAMAQAEFQARRRMG